MTTKNRMAEMPIALFLASAFLLSTYAKADTAATEATYKAKCASCHGADGKGKEALKTQDFASGGTKHERCRTHCGHHRWKSQDAGIWQKPKAGSG